MASSPGNGFSMYSHQALMWSACLDSILAISSCISHQSAQLFTSGAFLVHFILLSLSGSVLGMVLGKHSTIWSTRSRSRLALFFSLSMFILSSFFWVNSEGGYFVASPAPAMVQSLLD